MYAKKLSACVKVNNKVLREFGDKVLVPFGSEYAISIKNHDVRRVIAHITIDGKDAVPGGLVISANQTVDLERFVNDMNQGNRFKFIERTGSIEQHRGIKADDGLVRIEYEFEKVYPKFELPKKWEDPGYYPRPNPWSGQPYWNQIGGTVCDSSDVPTKGITRGIVGSLGSASGASATYSANAVSTQAAFGPTSAAGFINCSAPANEAGITVPGSVSDQKFQYCSSFATDGEKHVIILHLVGETEDNKPVEKPVTVKHKPKCVTCGRTNKATAKFCTNCGTALTIL